MRFRSSTVGIVQGVYTEIYGERALELMELDFPGYGSAV